jgi:tetratricopeptide (TPR) repeat protein
MIFRSILLSCLAVIFGCSSKESRSQARNCIALNNAAIDSIQAYNLGRPDKLLLTRALELLNKAIQCDSTYQLAYQNKLTVLIQLGKHSEALGLVEELERFLPEDPNIFTAKGLMYERMKKTDSANIWYDHAFKLCDQKLSAYPDSVKFIYDRTYLIAVTSGKESALNEINRYIDLYPDQKTLLTYREAIRNFDKEKVLGH